MKKIFSAIACAAAILLSSCAEKQPSTTTPAPEAAGESYATTINIRYVSLDSIQRHYVLSQTIQAEAEKLAMDLQSYQNQLANQLQSQANQIQQKAQSNGYLSEASYNADVKQLNDRQNSFQNQYAQREMNANQQMAAKQKALMDSINNFIIDFNKERKYDAILFRDAGLYFNPALDITAEVVDGLNARYKAPAETPAK